MVERGSDDTEKALRESEERYRTIFNAAPIGMSISDLDGRLVSANDAYSRLLGYTAEELHGLTFMDITHPDDLPADLDLFREAMAGERTGYEMTKRYIRKDGEIVWVRLTVVVLRDADGTPTFDFAMVEDITERRAYEEQLRHHALYDPLTDLPNRTLLQDRLHRAILRAAREGRSAAVLLVDLDRFKHVNDAFGHSTGDALLHQASRRLAGAVRASDTIARLHGDEFALILPATDADGAVRIAEKLQRVLQPPFTVSGHSLGMEASAGIALTPEHGDDPDVLLRHAGVALYAAKRGRSGHVVYSPQQDSYIAKRMTLMSDLRDAIEGNRLVLYFQPKIELGSYGRLRAEALVRWRDPERGLVPPNDFIPLAEETGLINMLGEWVLNAARRQYERWREMELDVPLAVNLSVHNLQDRRIRAAIETVFRGGHFHPGALEVEITETGLLMNVDEGLIVLERFRELGARVIIDDFGTGYSSLAYLAQLPVDEIKIDRSFVTDMRTNGTHRVIVRSTIDLAHNLGLVATAEGVEDETTLKLLAEMECDMVQGYHISPPLPAKAFLEWITAREHNTSVA